MIFNKHSELEGKHALLGASKYQWLNYDNDKLFEAMRRQWATPMGTALHELASQLIKHKMKITKSDKKVILLHLLESGIPRFAIDIDFIFENFQAFVNDAIGFGMSSEVVLYYSDHCFGTADTIAFRNNTLRIHDYKSGTTPARMEQLLIYAALFCLEYKIKPGDIQMELRIYQLNEVLILNPTPEDIVPIMDQIITKNKFIDSIRAGEV